MEPGNSGLTRQHTSDMLGAPTLLAGPREATRQSSGTEPKVAEGGSRGSEPPECQLWGGLPQEGLPLKGAQSKERQGGEEVDEDRDIDESSPQDSPPSQVSLTQGGPAPQAVSGEAPGTPGSPAGGAIPLPVDFLSKASADTRVPEPDGPSEGPPGEGRGGSPEFTFHVEITANLQKDQGPPSEVDLEGTALPGAPGEEQEPRSPSEGEDTKRLIFQNLLESSLQLVCQGSPSAGCLNSKVCVLSSFAPAWRPRVPPRLQALPLSFQLLLGSCRF